MSNSKSNNCTYIQESGDVLNEDAKDPQPLQGKEFCDSYTAKSIKPKKSKRQHSQSMCVSSGQPSEWEDLKVHSKDDSQKHICVNRLPYGKNSRKSRSGIKETKKGGKGVWNFKDLDFGEYEMDKRDPCYDSENDSVNFEVNTPTLKEEEFDDLVTNWIKEYFENSQSEEVLQNLGELNLVYELSSRIPYLCILQALQRKPAQCELTSRLLCDLIGNVINEEEMIRGFDLVIKEMSELTIDCPEAPEVFGKFIARAVADHLLPKKYVQKYKLKIENDYQIRAFAKAENLLSLSHAYARLDTVWGSPGGERPTKMLIAKIRLLLDEYLDSDDKIEAERCLRELEAPHFHHELVFQAILMAIEKSTEFVCKKMVELLDCLCVSVVITVDQLEQGVNRIYDQMPDIVLDVPAAYILLERFISIAQEFATFFPNRLACKMPKSTRSRFVSDGFLQHDGFGRGLQLEFDY